MGRGGEERRGEKRGKGKGPASQGRDMRIGKGMGREGRFKKAGRGEGRAGASILYSGGARVFAARGKRLCCRPPPSGVFRNLKRYISSVHFQKFSNFSIFFTVISVQFFHIQRCPGVGVPRSIRPWPIQSDRQLIFLWLQGWQWCGL